MNRMVHVLLATVLMALGLTACWRSIPSAWADDSANRDIPPAFAPFEYLVGQWKGSATPKDTAQSFRGWPEKHNWAWTFVSGKPTGLSVAIEGGKVLADGKLSYDAARKLYRLDGHAPRPPGAPIAFEGSLNRSGKSLVLEQVAAGPASGRAASSGTLRLTIWPNSNFIRYTMAVDRKDPDAVQFSHAIEVGLTKEGESLAGGTTESNRPKCIVTGGSATMTVTYNGQTFPLCCTGCRDEFNENPEKYIKKAKLMAQSAGAMKASQSAPARVSRFEDAFSGDVVDEPAKPKASRSTRRATAKPKAEEKPAAESDGDSDDEKPAARGDSTAGKGTKKAPASATGNRAAGLLRIGQNLEKSGKPDAALGYYRRIVKDFAGTPAAKTAGQRIKALETP
ncbi:MAG: YHS domain-containing protein [Isosphaeraceae bacterium]